MDSALLVEPAASLIAGSGPVDQLPLMRGNGTDVTAAVASLALGGAERIVLDWAAGCAAQHRVRLVVLRDADHEWPVPDGVEVTRLHGVDLPAKLEAIGARIAAVNPTMLCHLLKADERAALERGGVHAIPVLHNAAAGWLEPAQAMADARSVIAVSQAAADELRAHGMRSSVAVVRHIPTPPVLRADARGEWRARWALPPDALVIGMIGGVKPQKAYPRALKVLAAVRDRCDAYLVIVGGPVGRDGALAWAALLAQAQRLGLTERVRVPGFVPHATECLPAFDVVLNTSRYEGASIATLEALSAGLPVIAAAVGGQGELSGPGLALVPFDAADDVWADAVLAATGSRPDRPAWRGAPSHRVWTLFHLLRLFEKTPAVLFVTANLNAGGAQRSLVNLARALKSVLPFEIAVCGDSTSAYFTRRLEHAGVRAYRTGASRDCFDHAEAILRHAIAGRFGTVCFWNVDAKVKLLLAKVLEASDVRLVDVSPGAYAFEEMSATAAFQQWIAYGEHEYYARLDTLVLKYRGRAPPAFRGRLAVIPNGVPEEDRPVIRAAGAAPRIVVSGRIAPSKFLVETVAAMRLLWRTHPRAELHVLGTAEPRHADYAHTLLAAIGVERREHGGRIVLHGAAFDAPALLGRYDAALVLGEHQGSPNAVLEALAAGVPVVANDSGGTRELVIDGRTGVLLAGREPSEIAAALARVLDDPPFARRLGMRGQRHVRRRFSMKRMLEAYRALLAR